MLAQRFRQPGGLARLAGEDEESCQIEVCGVIVYCRGWCQRHYYRWIHHGDPLYCVIRRGSDRFNEAGERWCTRCQAFLPPVEFLKGRRKGRYLTWCSTCLVAVRYRLTRLEYLALLEGICPICLIRPKEVVDHDHRCCPQTGGRQTCGKCIRGGMCRQCNAAIGVLTEAGIFRAGQYITQRLELAI